MNKKYKDWDDYPICPHCDTKDEDLSELPSELRLDGDSARKFCSNCGAEYEIFMSVSYSFRTYEIDYEKERQEKIKRENKLAERLRSAGQFLPGDRVKIKEAVFYKEQLGTIANKELSSQGYIKVQVDGYPYHSTFGPEELEKV